MKSIEEEIESGNKDNMLLNIPNTDIWYKSYVMRNDVRGRYDFSVNDALKDFRGREAIYIIYVKHL